MGLALCFFLVSVAFRAKEFGDVIPNQQDAINYIRTVHQCAEAVRSGSFYPRLSSFDAGGRGYPVFQFYPPLSFLVPAYVSVLTASDVHTAVNVTIGLLYVATGFAFLSLARNLGLRRGPSVVGAFALLTFPYLTHISLLNIPMFFGLCEHVFLLAAGVSFLRRPSAVAGILVYLAAALLCLTHFLSVVLYLPCIAIFWAFFSANLSPQSGFWGRARICLLGYGLIVLGVLSCAFQLGPTVDYGLHQYLRMSNLLNPPHVMAEFAARYTTLSNLLSPRLSESNYLGAPFMGEYGFQLGLAYVAGLILATRRLATVRMGRASFGALLAMCVISIGLMNPAVVVHLPSVFGVFQFPTRFLALIAVPGALLLAYSIDGLARAAEVRSADRGIGAAPEGEIMFGATALLSAGVIAVSSLATQYLVHEDNAALTGFSNPVRLGQLLDRPASTYSEEYLLDAYHFAAKFKGQPLYGEAQYFIYWHRGFAENDHVYPLPKATALPAHLSLRAVGHVPDAIVLPQHLAVSLNGVPVGTEVIAQRDFTFEMALPESIHELESISYHSDRAVDVEGHKMVAQFSTILFEGFPSAQSVVYLSDAEVHPTWKRGSFSCTIPRVTSETIVVLPVLAYPGLQRATVNGVPITPLPIPQNDRVYCGFRLLPGENYAVTVVFTGSPFWNRISLAAFAVALAACVAAGTRRPVVRSS